MRSDSATFTRCQAPLGNARPAAPLPTIGAAVARLSVAQSGVGCLVFRNWRDEGAIREEALLPPISKNRTPDPSPSSAFENAGGSPAIWIMECGDSSPLWISWFDLQEHSGATIREPNHPKRRQGSALHNPNSDAGRIAFRDAGEPEGVSPGRLESTFDALSRFRRVRADALVVTHNSSANQRLEAGGFTAISRWLRSYATTPPEDRRFITTHPGRDASGATNHAATPAGVESLNPHFPVVSSHRSSTTG